MPLEHDLRVVEHRDLDVLDEVGVVGERRRGDGRKRAALFERPEGVPQPGIEHE